MQTRANQDASSTGAGSTRICTRSWRKSQTSHITKKETSQAVNHSIQMWSRMVWTDFLPAIQANTHAGDLSSQQSSVIVPDCAPCCGCVLMCSCHTLQVTHSHPAHGDMKSCFACTPRGRVPQRLQGERRLEDSHLQLVLLRTRSL